MSIKEQCYHRIKALTIIIALVGVFGIMYYFPDIKTWFIIGWIGLILIASATCLGLLVGILLTMFFGPFLGFEVNKIPEKKGLWFTLTSKDKTLSQDEVFKLETKFSIIPIFCFNVLFILKIFVPSMEYLLNV